MPTFANGESGESVRAKINAAIEQIESSTQKLFVYDTVAEFEAAVADGLSVADGTIAFANGVEYVAEAGNTTITDLDGWRYADAQIKQQYERNANTNAYTDSEKAKLSGIETGATADQTGAEIVTAVNVELGQTDWQSGGGGGGSSPSVEDDGTEIVATASTFNFTGDGVTVTDAGAGQADIAIPSLTSADIESGYNNEVAQVSGAERTAGTETAVRRFSPLDVATMAGVHGGGTSGSMSFASRSDAVTWIAANTPANGFHVNWPAASVVADSTASMITDMVGFKPVGMWTPQHFGDIIGISDSATIQAMWDASGNNQTFHFPPVDYDIDTKIDADINYRYVFAHGAWFNVSVDDVAFDLNPIADAGNITGTLRNYGYWYGGRFTSDNNAATQTAALKFYGIRQMTVRDVIIGVPSNANMIYGLMISGLGAHDLENIRYIYTQIGIYCPAFATGVNGAITTTMVKNNQWLLDPATTQSCVYVDCGWNRWTFIGGFANGTLGNLFHFTTNNESKNLTFEGFGFEQAIAGGRYVYIENTGTNPSGASNINFDRCRMTGNPSSGGVHTHVDLEQCRRVTFRATHTEADQGNGNWAVKLDADCRHFEADTGCRFIDIPLNGGDAISVDPAVDRREINLPDRYMTPTLSTSISNTSYSTSTQTLDMQTLLAGQYPTCGVNPIGYTLAINARDTGSAGTVDRRVELYRSGMVSTIRPTVSLSGAPDNSLMHQTIYAPANDDGSIQMDVYASGTNTFTMSLRVAAIHN